MEWCILEKQKSTTEKPALTGNCGASINSASLRESFAVQRTSDPE